MVELNLTKRQQEIFDFIKRYSARHGYPPTVRVGEVPGSNPGAPIGDLRKCGVCRAGGARSGASPQPRYRSIRGCPKCGKALLPPNQVIAEICWPSRVRTSIPYSRAISVWGGGK